jgi:hypothetical protein
VREAGSRKQEAAIAYVVYVAYFFELGYLRPSILSVEP